MTSFNTGFQLGASMYNNAERNRLAAEELELAKARDARAAEEFGWRRDQQAREDAAFQNFNNMAGGIGADQQAQLQQTYGMNPAQIAKGLQNGGAAGLKQQLASYDAPDSYDLQSVPAAGVQPGRFTADQLQTKEPSRMDMERAMGQLALARRDVQGMRASQTAMVDLQKSDIASKVMNMKTEDLEKLAPDINQSGYPLLYTGKGKGGYTFIATEADGKTPIAGSQFKLNESQLRQMALAHELGSAGFGSEAMATLSAAHKDIGDHVKGWNEAMAKMATTNNAATHYQEQGEIGRAHNAVLKNHYNKPVYTQFENDKGEPVYLDLSKAPQGANGQLQLPTGIRPMKQAAQLSDLEKIGYTKALEQINMLPPNAPQSAIADVYRRNGLDPAKFGGGSGLPASWGPQAGATQAPGPGPAPGPVPQGGLSYNQRLQGAYDRWMQAKAPWYMPTPAANSAERAAEEEYTALLRAGR